MKARFQFFYSFRFNKTPVEKFVVDVPTRDVLNTQRQNNKTEPYLEKCIENWCDCRQRAIRAAIQEACAAFPTEHYLILTTRHPETGKRLAVGFLKFDRARYQKWARLTRFQHRSFYPGSIKNSRLCSFSDAFVFESKYRYTPGARYGLQKSSDVLAARIIDHLESKENRIHEFRRNVRLLEIRLKQDDPEAFKSYWTRIVNGASDCPRCSEVLCHSIR